MDKAHVPHFIKGFGYVQRSNSTVMSICQGLTDSMGNNCQYISSGPGGSKSVLNITKKTITVKVVKNPLVYQRLKKFADNTQETYRTILSRV